MSEREPYFHALVACLRAAISSAYAVQVRRGYSAGVMAERLGVTEKQIARLLMVPLNINLSQIGELCYAMNCEPVISGEDGRISIGVHPIDASPPILSEGKAK